MKINADAANVPVMRNSNANVSGDSRIIRGMIYGRRAERANRAGTSPRPSFPVTFPSVVFSRCVRTGRIIVISQKSLNRFELSFVSVLVQIAPKRLEAAIRFSVSTYVHMCSVSSYFLFFFFFFCIFRHIRVRKIQKSRRYVCPLTRCALVTHGQRCPLVAIEKQCGRR